MARSDLHEPAVPDVAPAAIASSGAAGSGGSRASPRSEVEAVAICGRPSGGYGSGSMYGAILDLTGFA